MSAEPKRWRDDQGDEHIDVRGLPPPQPLVAILRLVREVQGAVIVHFDRDPLGLYPELAEIGWHAERLDAPAGVVRLRLARDP